MNFLAPGSCAFASGVLFHRSRLPIPHMCLLMISFVIPVRPNIIMHLLRIIIIVMIRLRSIIVIIIRVSSCFLALAQGGLSDADHAP